MTTKNSILILALLWPLIQLACLDVHGQPPTETHLPSPQTNTVKNVLLIAVDDLRPELGCYGVADAQSPNLDALARKSVLFQNHFVQVPTCGASRYALLTGRSPLFSGALQNQALYSGPTALSQKQLAGSQSLPEIFRRSGYRTVCIGKISHTPDGRVFAYDGSGEGRHELPNAWDELPTPFGAWRRGWRAFFAYANGESREIDPGSEDVRTRDVMQFVAESDDELPDGQMASEAIQTIKRLADDDQPFFMGLGFFKPHLPFVATKSDWDAFDSTNLLDPHHQASTESRYANRNSGEFFGYRFDETFQRPLTAEQVRRNRRAYLACVRYTDRQIGRVLDSLHTAGIADSTIVVLWSDHGWNLGDSQQWGKHTALEKAVRSPLMICVPGMATAGQQTDALVESIDLVPTLMELCQPSFTETEHRLDGKSLVPILSDPNSEIRSASFSYWKNAVSIRSAKYRLVGKIKDKSTGELEQLELYDQSQEFDPIENVAAEHPQVVAELVDAFKREAAQDR